MRTLLLTLALTQAPAPPAPPTPQAAGIPLDSYADSATASLVARARAARERNERLVTSYTASVSQRMGAGLRALSRDRMLFRQELTADIAWRRDGKSTITVTGARQAVPVARAREELPRHLASQVRWLVVNPAEDYLGFLGDDDDGFVYPLRDGGEHDYKFAAGDTVTLTLQSGKRLTLLQLQVIPRRSDWKLMSGSLWFDAETNGLVRAAFRPARPYELRRDMEKDDQEDVPSWVNATGEIKFVTLEYSYHENRWWMLRYVALDGVATMGSWLGMPFKFERVYSDYEVEGGTPPPAGSSFRPAGTARRRSDEQVEPAPEVRRARRDSLRTLRRACLDKAKGEQQIEDCWQLSLQTDTVLQVVLPPPEARAQLVQSATLGPPILEMGDLITEAELRGMEGALREIAGAPRYSSVQLPRGLTALLQQARYNRVEGLSLGIRGSARSGIFTADGLARIGIADRVPNGEAGISLSTLAARFRLAGYRRLAAVNPEVRPFGVVNSVWGMLAQRDDGDYFRTLGVELTGQNTESGWWSWRVYAERQKAAAVETDFSLPHVFDGGSHFRPNVVADRATQYGAALTLRGNEPLSAGFQLGGDVTLEGARGDFNHAKGAVTVRAIITPRSPLAVALEASAGTSTGSVPLQNRFYLGGPATLRGYDGAAMAGPAYWRGRVEVANTFPAARLAWFADAGWAGPRSEFGKGRALIGSGIGASFLDGLVRLDLSRALRTPTGWRFDLYFDGRL